MNVPTMNRPGLLTVRVSAEEMAMLQELADADGISKSDLVRQFIRRTHSERFGAAPAAQKKPKRR